MTDLECILLFLLLVAIILQVSMYYFYSGYTSKLENRLKNEEYLTKHFRDLSNHLKNKNHEFLNKFEEIKKMLL